MTKVQQRILADVRVRSADDESALGDGFWVYLRTGWCVAPGQHNHQLVACRHADSPHIRPYRRSLAGEHFE